MEKSVHKFLQFNGKNIYFISVDGTIYIAIKPICRALKVNYERQFSNLKKDKLFNQPLADQLIVAADGKVRKMTCLPEFYIYGWIFQIQSKSEELLAYKKECCQVLYNYFRGAITNQLKRLSKIIELNEEENRLRNEINTETPKYQKMLNIRMERLRETKLLYKDAKDNQTEMQFNQ